MRPSFDLETQDQTGVVLTGGKSRRFGTNKALADWDGEPLIASPLRALKNVFPGLLVVSKDPETYRFLEAPRVKIVSDRLPEQHPMGGVFSALAACSTEWAFVCACDMPLISPRLIRALLEAARGYAAAIPVWQGRPQPLCGVYSRRCAGVLGRMISEKRLRLTELFDIVPTRFFLDGEVRESDPQGLSFKDIDTREDYERLRRTAPEGTVAPPPGDRADVFWNGETT